MASILDRYGIKEVADVTFYEINDDGTPGAPVLYLDTLKVSTIEQTAEQAEARGGKGNPPLIIWDYGKEINVTLQDALFSIKSMAVMFGDPNVGNISSLRRTQSFTGTTAPTQYELPSGGFYTIATSTIYDETGATVESLKSGNIYYQTFDMTVKGNEIEISAGTFPGTYYITGDTYARSETTGKDEFFQFIIPKAKVASENTITMEAEGDPSVFDMNLRVMRPADGKMMKLIKYDVTV